MPPGTRDLARVPRIQMCCPTGGALPRGVSQLPGALLNCHPHSLSVAAGLDPNQALGPGTSRNFVQLIPVVTFLAPLASNFEGHKGSIGHTFMVCIHTENQNQGSFCPFTLLEISALHEPPLGHLRYGLTDVPPQPNSPPDNVINPDRPAKDLNARKWPVKASSASLIK